ncbi:hypothetical protein O181_098716 [Austropuccinia psidii MF-1]|uniref:Uncharacterized protein n=1 Tax=Austropuccinia psidii MF-1 TaxID=1389203 RepID=A0A9Q3JBG6_9BASI|nr:hypothetical protein [Austropuccinia psidii MF-1]
MDNNPKENSINMKYKSDNIIRKCHICQSTTNLANTCPKRGKINEVDIEKKPDVVKDDNIIEENSDDKLSIKSFFTAYHPQTDGLAERMIQTLEDMTSIHASTNKNPAILEKGWNPKLPQYSLRKDLIKIHQTAASFKGMLDNSRKHAVRCMEDSFAYAKDKWDKSHANPDFKVGDLVLLSTTNFKNIKGCKNLKDPFEQTFFIKALHGENAVKVELLEKCPNKHPKFPASLIKPYKSSDAEIFPLRNEVPQFIPHI